MIVLGIDPGQTYSGWALLDVDEMRVLDSGAGSRPKEADERSLNETVRNCLRSQAMKPGSWPRIDVAVCEAMVHYAGVPVGLSIFDTCVWIGRFAEAYSFDSGKEMTFMTSPEVKRLLTGSPNGTKPGVKAALVDFVGPKGTKKEPGPTFGVAYHAWDALALAVAYVKSQGPCD